MATKIRGRQIETDDFIKSVRNSDLDWTNDVNTASQKAIAQYVASAAGGVLVCTFNGSTMDKTPQEIYEAYQDGKFVVCVAGNIVYSIEEVFFQSSAYIIKFASVINSNGIPEIGYIMYNGSNWSTGLSVMQKQLVSGTNIKTINGNSLLGSGNITIDSDIFSCTFTLTSGITGTIDKTASEILQASNSNKSVLCIYGNEIYFLVSKNVLTFSRIIGNACKYISYNQSDDNWMIITTNLQTSLVSGTTIKTINNESILGSGNITIQGGGGGGDVNVIEVVKVNGTALTPDSDKAVDINDIPWSIVSSKPTIPDAVSGTNDGTNWTTITIGSTTKAIPSGGGGGSSTLSGLTDTSIVSPSTGEFLVYDGTESKWVNKAIATASTSLAGIVQLEDSTSSTATNKAATPNSVKSAYDLASAAIPKSTGTTAGDIIYFTAAFTPARLAKGTAGQVLTMNSGATAPEWATPSGGGLSNYDFTHTIASGVSGTVTVTFAANTRGSRMMTATADIGLAIVCNNSADNYIWVKNNGSSDIDVTINSVTYNNSSMSASNIFIPEDGITIPNGNVAEIGIVCNADGAFITARADLKANS